MSGKRYLPAIEHIQIRDLSLYKNKPIVDTEVRSGVFCLAGANGLGKSSFLAAVSFGLTGIVAEPGRKFSLTQDFHQENLQYSSKYFSGRVDELHRSTAEITLTFLVNTNRYKITRNLFEPEALTNLSITNEAGSEIAEECSDDKSRHLAYAKQLTADCRLGSFDQFVFLQHFILTFDERRELLFWNSAAINPALYLAFGLDPNDEIRASELGSLISKADSNARNAQWQATNARKRLEELGGEEIEEDLEYISLLEEHKQLLSDLNNKSDTLTQLQDEENDARIRLAELSATHHELRTRYDEEFAHRLTDHADVRMHPTIRSALTTETCSVCGATGHAVIAEIERKIRSHSCPLCSSELPTGNPSSASMEKLKELDEALNENQEKIDGQRARINRLRGEVQTAAEAFQAARSAAEAFERENDRILPKAPTAATEGLDEQRRVIEAERQAAMRRRDESRSRRDAYRAQLAPIQAAMTRAYSDAELKFVPLFRDLAKQFLGLDLDVFLEKQSPTRHGLGLVVQNERRRRTTELSESQRFFLDIALRMALVQHMTEPDSRATIYVDTPEGSLDIAYEARAGKMFGEFAIRGFNIIMTANINASQLLVRLAEVCTADHMKLVRMTDWAPLTEVQADEEALFDKAYSAIEKTLAAGQK
ncbi:AAA family ATPase [Streptomyces cellulosae]